MLCESMFVPKAKHAVRDQSFACMHRDTADLRACSGLRRPGVAVSTTGVGEAVMRAGLARRLGEALGLPQTLPQGGALPGAAAARVLREAVLLGQPAALPPPPLDCGALALRVVLHPASPIMGSAGSHLGAINPRLDSGVAGTPDVLARPCSGTAHAACAAKPLDPGHGPGSANGPACGTSQHCAAASLGRSAARDDFPGPRRPQVGFESGEQGCVVEAELAAGQSGGLGLQSPINSALPSEQGCGVEVELVAVHSARSLGAAWLAPGMAAPRCTFLRQRRAPGACAADAPICSFGVCAQWPLPAD